MGLRPCPVGRAPSPGPPGPALAVRDRPGDLFFNGAVFEATVAPRGAERRATLLRTRPLLQQSDNVPLEQKSRNVPLTTFTLEGCRKDNY